MVGVMLASCITWGTYFLIRRSAVEAILYGVITLVIATIISFIVIAYREDSASYKEKQSN